MTAEFEIKTGKEHMKAADIHRLLKETYWGKERTESRGKNGKGRSWRGRTKSIAARGRDHKTLCRHDCSG